VLTVARKENISSSKIIITTICKYVPRSGCRGAVGEGNYQALWEGCRRSRALKSAAQLSKRALNNGNGLAPPLTPNCGALGVANWLCGNHPGKPCGMY